MKAIQPKIKCNGNGDFWKFCIDPSQLITNLKDRTIRLFCIWKVYFSGERTAIVSSSRLGITEMGLYLTRLLSFPEIRFHSSLETFGNSNQNFSPNGRRLLHVHVVSDHLHLWPRTSAMKTTNLDSSVITAADNNIFGGEGSRSNGATNKQAMYDSIKLPFWTLRSRRIVCGRKTQPTNITRT